MLAIIVIAAVVTLVWVLTVVYVMPGVLADWLRIWRRR